MAHDPHAAHASADDEYLNPPSGSGHEHTDADVRQIIQFAAWLAVSALVVHVLMWLTFELFERTTVNKGPAEYPLAIEQGPRLPSGPRLQPIPANEIYQFRLKETAALDSYAWTDKATGKVQIPISEAMRLTVERGLPARTAEGASQAGEASGLMPTDASAGRAMERRRQ